MFDLLLTAIRLGRKAGFEGLQKCECRLDGRRHRLLGEPAKHGHFEHLEAVAL